MVAKKKGPSPFKDIKKGTLHKALGYAQGKDIPNGIIDKIVATDIGNKVTAKGKSVKVTSGIKRKAVFAKNARKFKH